MRTAVCLVLLLVSASPTIPASASEAPLFAMPLDGDAALYEVVTEGDAASVHVHFRWGRENVIVPGSLGRSAVTLSATLVADEDARQAPPANGVPSLFHVPAFNPGRDYAQHDPPSARQLSTHVSQPGGVVLARTTEWFELEDAADAVRGQWMHRTMLVGPCAVGSLDAILARVVGHAAGEAVGILSSCGARASFADGVFAAQLADVNITLTPSGGVFPSAWTFDSSDRHLVARMVGWRAGDAPLGSSPAFAPPATLPLIEWGAMGPATGELPDHRFRDAQAALAATDAGRAWFAANPDGRPLFATHAWSDSIATAPGPSDPWASRVKGVPCGPSSAPTKGAPVGEWTATWVAPGASLFAIVDRVSPAAPLTHGVERVVAATTDSYGTANSGVPSTRAPAPADLASHLHDLDSFQPRGTYSIDYAFVPTDHGDAQAAAAVSRGTCETDPATGRLAYVGMSMWFIDGRATSIVSTTIERGEDTPLAALTTTLLAPGPTTATSAPPLPQVTLWGGAAAVLVGGAALAVFAPRLVGALYSRIHRGEALDSDKRARLLEAVHRRPGASLRSLAEELAMPVNTVEHHARVLGRLKYVRRVRTHEGTAYYAAEHPRAPYAHVLDLTHAEDALKVVGDRADITQHELSAAIGVSPSHLSGLVKQLDAEGLIERRRDGRLVRLRLTARAIGSPAQGVR